MCQVEPGRDDAGSANKQTAGNVVSSVSYSQQYKALKGVKERCVLDAGYPKPSPTAQAAEPGAYKLIGTQNQYAKIEQRPLLGLTAKRLSPDVAPSINRKICRARRVYFFTVHLMALLLAPMTFSWWNVSVAAVCYFFQGMFGITMGYHRLLAHRSFKCHKWLEYFCAFMGSHAGQGDPIEWVSHHRYHHLHTDTPLDPHSPYEGFWWSYVGWLFNTEVYMLDFSNVKDMKAQKFYRYLRAVWPLWILVVRPVALYKLGGLDLVAWAFAVPIVYGWHTAWLVNSASHVWGRRPYATGDLSTNNWWVAALAFGEGWHNSHHAFPYSARHGLEWWEFDATWGLIGLLEKIGLVWDVRVPTEAAKASKRAVSESATVLIKQPAVDDLLTAKYDHAGKQIAPVGSM